MSFFIYVVTDLVHLIKIILICELFFLFKRRKSKHNKLMMIAIGSVMAIVSSGIYLYENDIVETVVYIFTICTLLYWLYEEKVLSMVISAICIIFIMSMFDTMSTILFDTLATLIDIDSQNVSRIGAAIISLLFVLILGKAYNRKYYGGINKIGIVTLFLFTLLTTVNTFVVMVMTITTFNEKQETARILFSIAFVLVIIGIFIQLGAVILLFMQRNVYKEKKQITEKYLNEQKNHYEYLENREKETKKFRHDLKSHMQLLSSFAKSGQYDKFDKYLERIEIKIETFGNLITVQNGIVDAIINQYYSKAKQNGIAMEVRGRFPTECAIDAYDLCTIFSNVLSNALEGAIETNEKKINVDCRYTDENIIIVVTNSFNDVGQFGDGKIRTHKEDVDYHGYGLENIKDSVEKYNGVLDIEITEDKFVLKILFNNIEKRDYENSNH